MKLKLNQPLFIIAAIAMIFSGCNKSSEDEFIEANDDVVKKYIKTFQAISYDAKSESVKYILSYANDSTVSKITDGDSEVYFHFNEDNQLITVTEGYDVIEIDELYMSPYDAFETGEVLEYDEALNPKTIEVYESGYGSEKLTGEISYDPNPNPFFYTFKACGIIEVLDGVDLIFGDVNHTIVRARKLLPNNNIKSMIFKNRNGITQFDAQFNYTYDDDGYPISASVNVSIDGEESEFTLIYTY